MATINEGPAAGKHAQAERGAVLTPGEKLGTCSRGTGFGANTCEKLSLKAQCQLQKGNYSAQDWERVSALNEARSPVSLLAAYADKLRQSGGGQALQEYFC